MTDFDVIIIGGGPAGLSAANFTSRADLDTLLIEHGASILKRNAIIENFLGFPRGIDSRLLLAMSKDQIQWNGATYREAVVTAMTRDEDTFTVTTQEEKTFAAENTLIATKTAMPFLDNLDVDTFKDGSKTYIETDQDGRTTVDRMYAAGRATKTEHQAIIAAGHGADVALTLIRDTNPDFYHDWVAPAGYFTNRGRETPVGCEEIPDQERRKREQDARNTLQQWIETPPDTHPEPHPSLEN